MVNFNIKRMIHVGQKYGTFTLRGTPISNKFSPLYQTLRFVPGSADYVWSTGINKPRSTVSGLCVARSLASYTFGGEFKCDFFTFPQSIVFNPFLFCW